MERGIMNIFRKTRKSISVITGVITGAAVFAVTITAMTDSSSIKNDDITFSPAAVYETSTDTAEITHKVTYTTKKTTVSAKAMRTEKTTTAETTASEILTLQPAESDETETRQPDTAEDIPQQDEPCEVICYEEQPEPPEVQLCCDQQSQEQPVQENTLSLLGTFESTAYTWTGCTCASGNYPYTCKNIDGINYRSVAVDTSIIPLGTRLYIDAGDYSGYVVAEDTGGCIYGYIMDVYMDSYNECINWGRRNITVYTVV
ncbi:MAG: 3D domain-containing protein [Oscillospiraceae bacterium]|nr:3D domain-containing protein [Oscillospiraceae bacterium]